MRMHPRKCVHLERLAVRQSGNFAIAIGTQKSRNHATAARCREIRSNPVSIAIVAAVNQISGELCNQPVTL
jgi:hypothetical protein